MLGPEKILARGNPVKIPNAKAHACGTGTLEAETEGLP